MKDREMKDENSVQKRAYTAPKMTEFGSVVELTQGSLGGTNDAGGSQQGGKDIIIIN